MLLFFDELNPKGGGREHSTLLTRLTDWYEPPLVDSASGVQVRWEKIFQGPVLGKASYQPVDYHMLLM